MYACATSQFFLYLPMCARGYYPPPHTHRHRVYNITTPHHIISHHTTPSTILGAVKGQKPYYPPPKPPASNATSGGERHMDAFAAAEKMATGVIARAKEVMRHPAFEKVW